MTLSIKDQMKQFKLDLSGIQEHVGGEITQRVRKDSWYIGLNDGNKVLVSVDFAKGRYIIADNVTNEDVATFGDFTNALLFVSEIYGILEEFA